MIRNTSLDAYHDTADVRETQLANTLRAFLEIGSSTADEILDQIDGELDIYQVRRRISDLVKLGKVEDTGERVRKDGRARIVWRVKQERQEDQRRLFV